MPIGRNLHATNIPKPASGPIFQNKSLFVIIHGHGIIPQVGDVMTCGNQAAVPLTSPTFRACFPCSISGLGPHRAGCSCQEVLLLKNNANIYKHVHIYNIWINNGGCVQGGPRQPPGKFLNDSGGVRGVGDIDSDRHPWSEQFPEVCRHDIEEHSNHQLRNHLV